MDLCATCDRATCDKVCLKKQAFAWDVREVRGFGFDGIPGLAQPASAALPRYVPVIQHGFVQSEDVSLPWAAIPLGRLLRVQKGRYGPAVPTAAGLRRLFSLSAETRVILLGVGKDRPIENYWRWRRMQDTPRALSALDFAAAIAPNYSFFLEDPRPQHLFNRKRSIICATELSRAGIAPVLCLQAVTPADWDFWGAFLTAHAEVSIVAEDFQTGLAQRERGLPAIERIAQLQDRLRRKLHLLAVGGGQYADTLAGHFDGWTVIDSMPFMKATHRRLAGAIGARVQWTRLDGHVGEMLEHNVIRWSDWISARARGELAAKRTRAPRLTGPSAA